MSSRRRDFFYSLGAGAAAVVFRLLLLWHNPYVFFHDDYQISIMPVFADVARSWSEGSWPLLSPYSWVCSNLAGEYQYGTFSLFVNAAVILIWQLPLAYWHQAAALSIVHLVVLAIGGYVLARSREIPPPLAVMVALVAALNGWIIAWGASDWFGALAAFTWLPWCWWALDAAAISKQTLVAYATKIGERNWSGRARLLLPGIFIYLLLTGGFPYTVVMLILVSGWIALQNFNLRALARMGVGWLLGLGLSAPAWLSLLEYSEGSRRAVERFLPRQWLVPLEGLPGLVIPSWTVTWRTFEEALREHPALELACGFAPMAILVAALLRRKTRFLREHSWELGLLGLTLLLASIPMAGLFRFSFRWLPLFHLVLALTAARAFGAGRLGPSVFVLPALIWAGAEILGLTSSTKLLPIVVVSAGLIWWAFDLLAAKHLRSWLPAAVAFTTLLATYLTLDPHRTVAKYWFTDALNRPAPLSPDRLYLSLYPAPQAWYVVDMTGAAFGSVVRPGSTSMWGGVHLINGYSPVGPAGAARLFDFGTHGHINPARVPETVMAESGPDGLLAQIGIDGLILAREFQLPGPLPNDWKLAHSEWEGEVWHRENQLPHVRALRPEDSARTSIRMVESSRHRVIAEVKSEDVTHPLLIGFSRPYFPGYQAWVNGRKVAVGSWRGLIPTVEIPPGENGTLELRYRPRAVAIGGSVALFSLLIGFVALLVRRAPRG